MTFPVDRCSDLVLLPDRFETEGFEVSTGREGLAVHVEVAMVAVWIEAWQKLWRNLILCFLLRTMFDYVVNVHG